jgi:hypothetical protein
MHLNTYKSYLNNIEHFLELVRFDPLKFVVDVPSLVSASCRLQLEVH